MGFLESNESKMKRLKNRYQNDSMFNRLCDQIFHLMKDEILRAEDIEDALSMAITKHRDFAHRQNMQLKEEFERT